MIITCASCLTKFNLDDARIPQTGVKVRCSRCQQVFYVVPPPETKEEVMEGFESFAKYHEELMVPGEEAPSKPAPGKEEEKPSPSPKRGTPPEIPSEKPKVPEPPGPPRGSEEEEDFFHFDEKTAKEAETSIEGFSEAERGEAKPSRPKETARSRKQNRFTPFLAVIIVLVLLIVGLFYLWTELGSGGKLSPALEPPIQRVKEIWNKVWGTEREGLDIGDLTGYEERVGEMPLFVIEGKVSNQSRFDKKQIKVKVVLFDQEKVKMAEKEAVCGRVLSRQELKSQPPDFFKGEMILKPQNEKERIVPSGKIASFMVIFRDPLNQAKEFKVEILEAPNL